MRRGIVSSAVATLLLFGGLLVCSGMFLALIAALLGQPESMCSA